MRRREVLVGVGSLGVLGEAGGVAVWGLPGSSPADGDGSDGEAGVESVETRTLDVRGSEAGTLAIPTGERTLIELFATSCNSCQTMMGRLAEAHEQVGERARFISVALDSVGQTIGEDEMADWWNDHDGNWTLGSDPESAVWRHFGSVGYPVTIVIDDEGGELYHENGYTDVEELIEMASG